MIIRFALQSGKCPVSSATLLEEEKYAEALDVLVIACVDIAVIHKGSILLGKRSRHPYPDWWILGGRMFRGEYFENSAKRILERESGILVEDETRFRKIGIANFLWEERAQEPAENGSQQISITMVVDVNDEEALQVRPNDEYSEFKWVPIIDAKKNGFHQYVKECVETVEFLNLGK